MHKPSDHSSPSSLLASLYVEFHSPTRAHYEYRCSCCFFLWLFLGFLKPETMSDRGLERPNVARMFAFLCACFSDVSDVRKPERGVSGAWSEHTGRPVDVTRSLQFLYLKYHTWYQVGICRCDTTVGKHYVLCIYLLLTTTGGLYSRHLFACKQTNAAQVHDRSEVFFFRERV